jgi:5'-methylthioadenosine phosphorylase
MVTDYDCWREEDDAVDVTSVLKVMRENTKLALKLIDDLTKRLGSTRAPSPLGIETCLDHALITPPEARDPSLVANLQAVAGRAFRAGK